VQLGQVVPRRWAKLTPWPAAEAASQQAKPRERAVPFSFYFSKPQIQFKKTILKLFDL
jgi:hypothetical protein